MLWPDADFVFSVDFAFSPVSVWVSASVGVSMLGRCQGGHWAIDRIPRGETEPSRADINKAQVDQIRVNNHDQLIFPFRMPAKQQTPDTWSTNCTFPSWRIHIDLNVCFSREVFGGLSMSEELQRVGWMQKCGRNTLISVKPQPCLKQNCQC